MLHDEFDRIFEETVEKSRSVLASKSKEYATEDKLHNFKVAAVTEGVSNRRALGGMMVKHTVSIYDLLRADECADLAMWDEKIGDHINYLILLRALVIEELGDEVFEAVADVFAESLKQHADTTCPVTGISPGDSDEVIEEKLIGDVPDLGKVVLKTDFDPPSMPTVQDNKPLKSDEELHTTYKCSSCESEVVNITKSGTIYDRISCRNCTNTFGRLRYMYPIIDNPRSGVKNAVISDKQFDVKSKAQGVNISYYCATCGQTSIKKYPNDGASILDNSGMTCPVDNCGGWAEVTHWSAVLED